MSGIKEKVVLITGASSGLGEATARRLARSGARLVLGARRTDRLEALTGALRAEGATVHYRQLDVTRREEMEAFVGFARETFGRVDVLVNNAGVMPLSPMEALKVEEWDRMIDVNIRGVLHGVAAGLPVMKRQGSGHFINLSSIGGHAVYPSAAVYCATKFAVMAISEGLRQELAGSNIRVTIISPGTTESELADTISDAQARQEMREFRKSAIPADAVARAIQYTLEQPEDVLVSELIVRPTVHAA